jgi:DNA-binding winged helix-turn-helix (wHTH) protein
VTGGDGTARALPSITVDRLRRVLIGPAGARVELPLLSLRLLELLAAHAPGFVDARRLLTQLWPDTHIGADALKQRVRVTRRALMDAGYDPQLLDSVRGEGYALRATLVDGDAAATVASAPPRTVEPRAPAPQGTAPPPARQRVALVRSAALMVVALGVGAWWWSGRAPSGPAPAMGPSPVRIGIAADVRDPLAARLTDLLSDTPHVLLVPAPQMSGHTGVDPCAAVSAVHLCLSVAPSPEREGEVVVTLGQRRSGAVLLRESLATSRAADSAMQGTVLRAVQFASPTVLRWLGGSGTGDYAFTQYREGVRVLGRCTSDVDSAMVAAMRAAVARAPHFHPGRAMLVFLEMERAVMAGDRAAIARRLAVADTLVAQGADVPLALIAVARGAHALGDTAHAAEATARARRAQPVLRGFLVEAGVPSLLRRC